MTVSKQRRIPVAPAKLNPQSPVHGSQHTLSATQNNPSVAGRINQRALSVGSAAATATILASTVQPLPAPTLQKSSSIAAQITLPRGPPRKPRQSGHALWVGNLPPGTNVFELKDFFSDGASKEIESVFLISKSNCAFINYKTDVSCNDAMTRFHDSRFKGVRLVCRLRRNSTTAPGATSRTETPNEGSHRRQDRKDEIGSDIDKPEATGSAGKPRQPSRIGGDPQGDCREIVKDRIFIVKSLTVEDLDLSVKNGVWATQSHNEEILNEAFDVSK